MAGLMVRVGRGVSRRGRGAARSHASPRGPESAGPSGGAFMIVSSFGRIAPQTAHDHAGVPGPPTERLLEGRARRRGLLGSAGVLEAGGYAVDGEQEQAFEALALVVLGVRVAQGGQR